ncbi:unnamed protein product [Somion occarium]|uniref:MFS general substrate transporter n=1 Tax=Somion occarium TaxID=3059160 RepID=A0ABP1E9C6_9APHY
MAPEIIEPVYQASDAIVSSNFSPFSPSVSRARRSVSNTHAGPSRTERTQSASMLPRRKDKGALVGEHAPLLGAPSKKVKKPFFRPRPMWLVPFAVVASIRGMTLAPRVQVFTQLSCNAIYGHDVYDHTNVSSGFLPAERINHLPLHFSLDPSGPHLDTYTLHSLDLEYHSSPVAIPLTDNEDDDDDEPDPRSAPSKRCLSDPAVQAGAARIQTIMTTTMGALSALTTGWWGHFGERHGRTRVLAASTLGLFLTDLTFILVSTPHSIFAAHGHKLLIISPFIEGLLGGWSTLQGATSAYVSDCTSDGSRAHIFSRFTGVFYLGFSLGPALGAFLIRHPLFPVAGSSFHNGAPTVTSVFYVAAVCSFVNLLLVVFVFPESLDKKKALQLQRQSQLPDVMDDEQGTAHEKKQGIIHRFFSPFTIFLPKKIQTPEGNYRYDWSLTLLGLALFGYLLSTGIFQIKYLYAEHVYGWGAEQLSYYISFMGGARALHLLLIMPWVILTFKPKPKPKAKFAQSVTPANSVVTRSTPLIITSPVSPATTAKKSKPTLALLVKEMSFDLMLIRISLFLDFLSHALVSIAPPDVSEGPFVGFTVLSSFGAGLIPATNSFALCVMQMQAAADVGVGNGVIPPVDGGAGRLFGALAVLQAVGQMILGPMLFGLIYSTTVAKFPKTIFMTAAGIVLFSMALISMIRPDVAFKSRQQQRKANRIRDDFEIERGRSRISKNLSNLASPSSPLSGTFFQEGSSSSGSLGSVGFSAPRS